MEKEHTLFIYILLTLQQHKDARKWAKSFFNISLSMSGPHADLSTAILADICAACKGIFTLNVKFGTNDSKQ